MRECAASRFGCTTVGLATVQKVLQEEMGANRLHVAHSGEYLLHMRGPRGLIVRRVLTSLWAPDINPLRTDMSSATR